MAPERRSRLSDLLTTHGNAVLEDWIDRQLKAPSLRGDLMDERALREQSARFLELLAQALPKAPVDDFEAAAWDDLRRFLQEASGSRARLGFGPTETATFIFSLKELVFARLREALRGDGAALAEETWNATVLLDRLGLYTMEVYVKGREQVISRQQQELMELSTPVVELWDGVLGLPLIGTLDSARTQVVMESLLQRIVETGATIAIIDITGVPTVDTLVAQHLLKTIAAARLMGADCIISGIRPHIAQTIVHLGVDLNAVVTKATLADAFKIALGRTGFAVVRGAQP